ncbi:hypothetical protein AAC387_Pa03g2644 [Persea americana]
MEIRFPDEKRVLRETKFHADLKLKSLVPNRDKKKRLVETQQATLASARELEIPTLPSSRASTLAIFLSSKITRFCNLLRLFLSLVGLWFCCFKP